MFEEHSSINPGLDSSPSSVLLHKQICMWTHTHTCVCVRAREHSISYCSVTFLSMIACMMPVPQNVHGAEKFLPPSDLIAIRVQHIPQVFVVTVVLINWLHCWSYKSTAWTITYSTILGNDNKALRYWVRYLLYYACIIIVVDTPNHEALLWDSILPCIRSCLLGLVLILSLDGTRKPHPVTGL